MTARKNLIFDLCVKACSRDDSWKNDLATFGDDDLTQETRDLVNSLITRHAPYFDDPSLLVNLVTSQDPNIMPTKFTAPAAASRVDKTLRFFTPTIKFGENTSASPNIVRKDNVPTRFTLIVNAQWHTVIGQEPMEKKGVSAFIVKIINRGSGPSHIKIGVTSRKIAGDGSAALGNGHYLQSTANTAVMGPHLYLHNGHVNDDAALGLPLIATQGVTYVTVIVNTNSLGSIRYLLDGREVEQDKQPFLFPEHFNHSEGETEWRPCVSFHHSDAIIEFVRTQELPAYFNSFSAHNHLVAQRFKPAKNLEEAFGVTAENGNTFANKLKYELNGQKAALFLVSPPGQGKSTLCNAMVDALARRHGTGTRCINPVAGTAAGQASLTPNCFPISKAYARQRGFWNVDEDGDMYINDLVGLEKEPTQYMSMFRAYAQGRLGGHEPFPTGRDYPGGGPVFEEVRRKVLDRDVASENTHASCIIFPISADSVFENNPETVQAFNICREMAQYINRHPLHVKDAAVRNAKSDNVEGGVAAIPFKVVITKIDNKYPDLPPSQLLHPQESPILQPLYNKLTKDWNIDINDIVITGWLNNTTNRDFSDGCDGYENPEVVVIRQLLLDAARVSANFLTDNVININLGARTVIKESSASAPPPSSGVSALSRRIASEFPSHCIFLSSDIKFHEKHPQPLGSGGSGDVFKATLAATNRPVAVKRFRYAHSERALQECAFAIKLHHRNIISTIGITIFIGSAGHEEVAAVLELGKATLHEKLVSKLEWRTVFKYCFEIASGLDYLHNHAKMNHLDLKPTNVLLDESNIVKLCDFGLSRVMKEDETHADVSRAGFGTLRWMCPEQYCSTEIRPSNDVYSFGCILYNMIDKEGRKPWYDVLDKKIPEKLASLENLTESILARHISSEHRADCPPFLLQLCKACLNSDYKKRPKHGGELVEVLKSGILEFVNTSEDWKVKLGDVSYVGSLVNRENSEDFSLEQRWENTTSQEANDKEPSRTKKVAADDELIRAFLRAGNEDLHSDC